MKFQAGLGLEAESLYLGTENGVLRIPNSRCERHKSRERCMSSGDPYCGWNTRTDMCSEAPNHNPRARYWEQANNGFACAVTKIPVSFYALNGLIRYKIISRCRKMHTEADVILNRELFFI